MLALVSNTSDACSPGCWVWGARLGWGWNPPRVPGEREEGPDPPPLLDRGGGGGGATAQALLVTDTPLPALPRLMCSVSGHTLENYKLGSENEMGTAVS